MASSYILRSWPAVLSVLVLSIMLAVAVAMRGADAVRGVLYRGPGGQVVPEDLKVNFGVYDPQGRFSETPMAIEHFFIQWNTYQAGSLNHDLLETANLNRWPMVTVEPFPSLEAGPTAGSLLADVVAGKYDAAIRTICTDIHSFGRPVFVRWGQEMENVTGRYPWATPNGPAYVAAYRHFVDQCRLTASGVFYVWSPTGDNGLDKYWPGQTYVDYVGISVFGFPDYDLRNYGKVLSFAQVFGAKYDSVREYAKPLMVAEMGVTGSAKYQKAWLEDGLRAARAYPELRTLVYFNSVDSPQAWGSDYPVPDWSIDPNLFRRKQESK